MLTDQRSSHMSFWKMNRDHAPPSQAASTESRKALWPASRVPASRNTRQVHSSRSVALLAAFSPPLGRTLTEILGSLRLRLDATRWISSKIEGSWNSRQ